MEQLSRLNYVVRFLLVIPCITACISKEDRDHLIFIDPIEDIERNMKIVDNILPHLPPQVDSMKIQSYFFDIVDNDTVLYINAKKIGIANSKNTKSKLDSIFKNKSVAEKFISSSRLLARNDLSHCLNIGCAWVYIYKYSNDRNAFRPVTLKHPGMVEKLQRDYYLIPIDQRENIILFKREINQNQSKLDIDKK